MLGPPPGLGVMGAEKMMMKRVRKKRVKRGKAAQLLVPGLDQRKMGEVW